MDAVIATVGSIHTSVQFQILQGELAGLECLISHFHGHFNKMPKVEMNSGRTLQVADPVRGFQSGIGNVMQLTVLEVGRVLTSAQQGMEGMLFLRSRWCDLAGRGIVQPEIFALEWIEWQVLLCIGLNT